MHVTRPTAKRIALAALAALLLAGCNGPASKQPGANAAKPRLLADVDGLMKIGLKPFWHNKVELLDGDRLVQAALVDDQIVLLSDRNICYTVDTEQGTVRPLVQIAPRTAGPSFPVSSDGQHYFFPGTRSILGVNAVTGAVDVKIRLDLPASTRAVSDQTYVYVGALDGRVFAYALESQVLHWSSKMGEAVKSIALAGDTVAFARSGITKKNGEVLAIRPPIWEEITWRQPTEGPVSAPIVAVPGPDGKCEAVFVACEDGSLYRFNGQRGWYEWRVRTPGTLVNAPVVLSDRVVQIVPGAGTWVIDRNVAAEEDKQVIWKSTQQLQFLGRTAGRMYFLSDGKLLAVKPDTGESVGSVPLAARGKLMVLPNTAGDRVFLLDDQGHLMCCVDLAQPYLIFDK